MKEWLCEAVSGFGGLFSRMDPVSRSGCWNQMFSSRFLLCLFSLCLKTTTSSHTAEKQRCVTAPRSPHSRCVLAALTNTWSPLVSAVVALWWNNQNTNKLKKSGGRRCCVCGSFSRFVQDSPPCCVCARLHTNATAWLHACVCVIRSACYAASHYIHMVVPHSQFYFHVFKYGQ